MKSTSNLKGYQSIHRTIALLRAGARRNDIGARLSRLAQDVGLHVSTARRILHALVAEGTLNYDAVTKFYHLGFELFLLGSNAHHYTLRDHLRTSRYPQYSRLTAEDIKSMSIETRQRGYSLSEGLFHKDAVIIGIPARDRMGNVIAAVTVAAIRSRMTEVRKEKIVALVRKHTASITSNI